MPKSAIRRGYLISKRKKNHIFFFCMMASKHLLLSEHLDSEDSSPMSLFPNFCQKKREQIFFMTFCLTNDFPNGLQYIIQAVLKCSSKAIQEHYIQSHTSRSLKYFVLSCLNLYPTGLGKYINLYVLAWVHYPQAVFLVQHRQKEPDHAYIFLLLCTCVLSSQLPVQKYGLWIAALTRARHPVDIFLCVGLIVR